MICVMKVHRCLKALPASLSLLRKVNDDMAWFDASARDHEYLHKFDLAKQIEVCCRGPYHGLEEFKASLQFIDEVAFALDTKSLRTVLANTFLTEILLNDFQLGCLTVLKNSKGQTEPNY